MNYVERFSVYLTENLMFFLEKPVGKLCTVKKSLFSVIINVWT
jgi:hypothetical protein